MDIEHRKLLVVVGPTATGKSELAVNLAQLFDGELVGADSRQIYRHMDIGTAKPHPDTLVKVPHHLVSIVNPDELFNLAQYQIMACEAITNIQAYGKIPLLTGGSGQYVRAGLEGWRIPMIPPDPEFRNQLENLAGTDPDALHQQLLLADSEAGVRIDPRNVRRVIRALEVHKHNQRAATGEPRKQPPGYDTCVIGLTCDREELYLRIDRRVDGMVNKGLVEEVARLLEIGYEARLPALSGIGYRQIIQYLRGDITLPVAIQQIKSETHRYVRQQYNWFRLQDERIQWFNITEQPENAIAEMIARFLGSNER